MRAIDTNVVVRFLTDDDVEQSARARRLVSGGGLFVAMTVWLETEWVLRTAFACRHRRPSDRCGHLPALPGIVVEDAARLTAALDWAAAGVDVADAVHLAGARDCTAFVSFDRALAKTAARLSALSVVEP